MLIDNLSYKELSSDIFLFEKAISKELCNQVINIIEKYPSWEEATIGINQNVDVSHRSNKVDYLTNRYGYNAELYYAHNTLGYYTKKVVEELNRFYYLQSGNYECSLFNSISGDEGFQILKYNKDEEYLTHIDSSNKVKRVVSLIIYLNDNYIGGETTFIRQDIKLKGNTGDILAFPSNYCFPHRAEKIVSGTKYVMVTWFI